MPTQLPNDLHLGYATEFPEDIALNSKYHWDLDDAWPEYLDLAPEGILGLLRKDPHLRQFQVYLIHQSPGSDKMRLVGMGNSVPFYWHTPDDNDSLPMGGWDTVATLGVKQHWHRTKQTQKLEEFESRPVPDFPVYDGEQWTNYDGGEEPNALCALSVAVLPEFRTPGLAEAIIKLMRERVVSNGYVAYIVPVRPTRKPEFKTLPLKDYLRLDRSQTPRDDDNLLADKDTFDPWVRKHISLGGTPIKIAQGSMVIRAKGSEWDRVSKAPKMCEKARAEGNIEKNEHDEEEYVDVLDVPGTLVPVRYYFERDEGVYCEPNLWIRHI